MVHVSLPILNVRLFLNAHPPGTPVDSTAGLSLGFCYQLFLIIRFTIGARDCRLFTMKAENALRPASFGRLLHRVLEVGILLKGFDAILEMIGGILLWFASNVVFDQWVLALTRHELVEDPQDKVVLLFRQAFSQISVDARLFGGGYLLIHGLAKFLLVLGLLRGKLWAYPATFGFLTLFIIYQIYQLSYNFSSGLLMLTFFDTVFALLILREFLVKEHVI